MSEEPKPLEMKVEPETEEIEEIEPLEPLEVKSDPVKEEPVKEVKEKNPKKEKKEAKKAKAQVKNSLSLLERQLAEKNPSKIWVKTIGRRFIDHTARSAKANADPYHLTDSEWTEITEPLDIAFFLVKKAKGAKFKVVVNEPKAVAKARKDHLASMPKELPAGVKLSMGVK